MLSALGCNTVAAAPGRVRGRERRDRGGDVGGCPFPSEWLGVTAPAETGFGERIPSGSGAMGSVRGRSTGRLHTQA